MKLTAWAKLIFCLVLFCQSAVAKEVPVIERARQELSAGSYGRVLKLLQSRNDAAASLVKLKAGLAMEDYDVVCTFMKAATVGDPPNVEAAVLRWQFLSNWKEPQPEAVPALRHLLQSNPKNADVRSTLGRWLCKNGKRGEGFKEIKTAYNTDPNSLLCSRNLADYYIEELDDKNALLLLDHAVASHSQSTEPLIMRGLFYEHSGHGDLALADYSHAIQMSPSCPPAYFHRARILFSQGDYKKSLVDCQKAIDADETGLAVAKMQRLRIKCYRKLGQIKDAVELENKLFKGSESLKHMTGGMQSDLLDFSKDLESLGQYQSALLIVQQVLRCNPKSTSAAFLQANLHEKLNNNTAALTEFSALIARDPNIAEWYRCRAAVLKKLGKYSDANADLKKADELNKQL